MNGIGDVPRWTLAALCRDMPRDIFDDQTGNVIEAKRVCARCPVRAKCLGAGMAEEWGIWGGFTGAERRLLAAGVKARICDDCGLYFVRSDDTTTCGLCTFRPVTSEYVEAITRLAGEGLVDREIAERLSQERGEEIKTSQVRGIRRRHQIKAGSSVHTGADGRHSRRGGKGRAYEESAVLDAEQDERIPLGHLSIPEQTELMRRWLAKGGTAWTFARRYRCSGTRARQLEAMIEETAQ